MGKSPLQVDSLEQSFSLKIFDFAAPEKLLSQLSVTLYNKVTKQARDSKLL